MIDLDLFCGAGGASRGMHEAGLDPIGFERWPVAAEAHQAAGFSTVVADLDGYPWPRRLRGGVRLMWASPPCQPFSAAGDQQGGDDARDGIPWWLAAVDAVRPTFLVMENVRGLTFDKHESYLRGVLGKVRGLGYDFRWAILDAADYGVPQNRQRFVLIARNDGGPLAWPSTTHCDGGGLFAEPWVTMNEALRAAATELNTGRAWKAGGDRDDAQTVTLERPSPAVTGKAVGQWQWKPARTLTATRGHVGARGRDYVNFTCEEAALLQGFPPGYPFKGNKTHRAMQIGNAVPPPLAAAVVSALLNDR